MLFPDEIDTEDLDGFEEFAKNPDIPRYRDGEDDEDEIPFDEEDDYEDEDDASFYDEDDDDEDDDEELRLEDE